MTYRGHIKNGVAVLDEPMDLPDGTPVLIQPVVSSSLKDALREVIGQGKNLPDDGSLQHDHYIYGSPKR